MSYNMVVHFQRKTGIHKTHTYSSIFYWQSEIILFDQDSFMMTAVALGKLTVSTIAGNSKIALCPRVLEHTSWSDLYRKPR